MKPILIILALFSGCTPAKSSTPEEELARKPECEYVGNSFYRCVNDEVICYHKDSSMSCVKK